MRYQELIFDDLTGEVKNLLQFLTGGQQILGK